MPAYTITEPHPTVRQNTYTHAGRGGAGNFFRAPQTTSPAGVPTPIEPVTTNKSTGTASSTRFYSGRGGAGNAHKQLDRPVMSFVDEFARADNRAEMGSSGFHVGRGGAGNFTGSKGRQGSSSSSSSNESSSSSRSGVLGRLSSAFSRH